MVSTSVLASVVAALQVHSENGGRERAESFLGRDSWGTRSLGLYKHHHLLNGNITHSLQSFTQKTFDPHNSSEIP